MVKRISRKIGKRDILRKLLYARDLAVVAHGEANLQEQSRKIIIFSRHGPRVRLEKTDVMWVGLRRKKLEIYVGGKQLRQRYNLFYLSGAICGDSNFDIEIRRRLTAGTLLGGKA